MTQLTLVLDDLFDELDRESEAPKVRIPELNETGFAALAHGFISFLEYINSGGWTDGSYRQLYERAKNFVPNSVFLSDLQRLPRFMPNLLYHQPYFNYPTGAYFTQAMQRCSAQQITLNFSELLPTHGLCSLLENKNVVLIGNVGTSCGWRMKGCELTVTGETGGELAALHMTKSRLFIMGNVGNYLGRNSSQSNIYLSGDYGEYSFEDSENLNVYHDGMKIFPSESIR